MIQTNKIYQGDSLEVLKTFPDNFIDCCVTSPPYYGLRDYGMSGQIGLEETPEAYVQRLVEVFAEVKRVLKKDGTLWINLGDSYYGSGKGNNPDGTPHESKLLAKQGTNLGSVFSSKAQKFSGYKPKDLLGIPWLVAFALRADGWYLRSDIIWAKKNCMPESVTDRPTRSHEYIFLLSKSRQYYYDHEAIKERALYDLDGTGTEKRKARQKEGNKLLPTELQNGIRPGKQKSYDRRDKNNLNDNWDKSLSFRRNHKHQIPIPGQSHVQHRMDREDMDITGMRNKRDVWHFATAQFPEAHFAVFPTELVRDPIKAGSRKDGIVLDPFCGSNTTGYVAEMLGRKWIGIELNPEYITLAEKRLFRDPGLFKKEAI